jgi:hypothetical protein
MPQEARQWVNCVANSASKLQHCVQVAFGENRWRPPVHAFFTLPCRKAVGGGWRNAALIAICDKAA